MRQRVSLARTLAYEPDVILMDEPFGALDAFTRTALQEELLRISDKTRLTVLLITHDLSEAIVLGHRVFVMTNRPGRVLDVFPIDLPEPRSASRLQGTEEYQQLFQRLWNVLMVESDAAKRQMS
jgi:NitT/TauT family transport system ATP-binding protein